MHITASKLNDITNVGDALSAAGLNWIAEEQPLLTGSGKVIDTHKAILRSDNNSIIGIVGSGYKVIQNGTAFVFFDTLCSQYQAKFTDAYVLGDGAKVILKAYVNGNMKIKKGDELRKRISLFNSFDGSIGVMAQFEVYRMICKNGLMGWAKENKVYIRHTGNAETRLTAAMEIMAKSTAYFQKFEQTAKILANKIADTAMVERFLKDMFGSDSKRTENTKDEVRKLTETGAGNGDGSLWSLYNGLTDYVDHFRNDDSDKLLISSNFGSGVAMKEKAWDLVVAYSK
jgi:phage/plasmid-like protein (TIGR03299 family)